ncbi:MAG: hypothetical protein HY755_04250 [Nitrospirae bacterium]|nr:hypothetical protein [Nitrospirota bacterium]
MLVIVKSAPDTTDGERGIKFARDMAADIVLLQNGAYFVQGGKLEDLGFVGTAYILDDDRKLRGLKESDFGDRVKEINYDGVVDLMTESDKVVGMF